TTIATVGTTSTTTVSTTSNNGNSSTSVYTITTATPSSTVVQTQTCVTVPSGTTQVTTCTLQTVGNPALTVTQNTVSTVASNLNPVSTFTNVYNPGPITTSPNPLAADYFLNIASLNNCILPGKIKFTVSPNTTIDPNGVEFFDPVTNISQGILSPSLFTITSPTLGIALNSTPTDLLASCANSIIIQTSIGNDHVISIAGDNLSVYIPNIAPGFTVSSIDIYSYSNTVASTQSLTPNFNNPINTTSLPIGVYEFQFTLTLNAINYVIKGQFIKLI
ncbi:MAG: hypothetical protein H0W73_20990, partial [Bacteroidetes bacterium]|nr:hypothetical protein [Bacteroidota bacterium]